jgi:hypothetical protein
MNACRGAEISNSALDGDQWKDPSSGYFTLKKYFAWVSLRGNWVDLGLNATKRKISDF